MNFRLEYKKRIMVENPITLDFFTKGEVQDVLDRLRDLINSKILWEDFSVLYRRAVLIEVLIHSKQLLIKASNLGHRISFTEEVVEDENLKIRDVTDLISNFRDAACHSDSHRSKVGNMVSYFNESRGGAKGLEIEEPRTPGNEDDIAFIMGKHTLYLRRHLEKAYAELEVFFRPLVFM